MNAIAPAWETFWQEAKLIPIEDVASRLGAKLKQVGPERMGHCPLGCTRNGDGFSINVKDGSFLCRPSGAGGGVIEMVMHVQNCSNIDAVEFITGQHRPDGKREESPEEKAQREKRRADAQMRADELAAEREREAAEKAKRDEGAVAEILARLQPFPGSYAERYMREGRGITLPKRMTRDLNFVPDLPYFGYASDEAPKAERLAILPAMVALIRNLPGDVIGVHLTYLDPGRPAKWTPIGSQRKNKAKKFRKTRPLTGSMIRLGVIGETLVVGEGIETTGSYFQLGRAPEDATFAVAMDKGNMTGGSLQQVPHPYLKSPDGKPVKIPNGVPDPDKPGLALPEHVRNLILLGDGDSEYGATRASMLAGVRRYRAEGRKVEVDFAPRNEDWNDVLKGWRGA